MKVSIIIPSFKRSHLLKWNLLSLSKQTIPFEFETIVLNDGIRDETEALCEQYKERLNIKYIFTGHRNTARNMKWRVPGFVINIGVKQSTGDIIVLCCAEIFHLNNTIDVMVKGIDDKVLAIPKARDDLSGAFLKHVESLNGNFSIEEYNKQPELVNVKFPFFLAMKKKEFMDIGGYDEDFIGTDYDDRDFVERLMVNGCYHVETDAMAIHLWHPRLEMSEKRIPKFEYNKSLYEQRVGIIMRNVGRDWGIL